MEQTQIIFTVFLIYSPSSVLSDVSNCMKHYLLLITVVIFHIKLCPGAQCSR